MRKKHGKGIETLKAKYGLLFVTPWIIGMALFFIIPIVNSIYYSFTDLSITESGIKVVWTKFANYHNIISVDPDYMNNLLEAFSSLLISLPFILIVSLVLALLLNGEYFGRVFFRGLFFIPVIFASGAVLELFLRAGSSNATETAISSSVSFGMVDFTTVLEGLHLPQSIEKYLSTALSNVFMLVWQSGIQTILLIAGLQSIPDLLYEVAKVEGANKWEELWFITLPMLLKTIILVIIFTVVQLVSSNTNTIIKQGYAQFNTLKYGIGSAMMWFYYIWVGVLLGIIFFIYKKVFLKKWG